MISFGRTPEIINGFSEGHDFPGAVTPRKIREADETLGVKLPRSYRHLLERYGCGNFGCEVYGVTPSSRRVPSAVWYALQVGKEGFIQHWMVVACNEGEYAFCFNTAAFDEIEECQVIGWIHGLPAQKQPCETVF